MSWPAEAVTVRVPATSANLGPGFDTLGLALSRHDEVAVRATAGGLVIDVIDVSGEGGNPEALAALGEDHLIVRAMRAAFDAAGRQPPGLALRCVNRISHGRGLGSSAAAIVAGVLGARALLAAEVPEAPANVSDAPAGAAGGSGAVAGAAGAGARTDPGRLTDDGVFALAAAIEGHPDNVAACLAGGLTIAWLEGSAPRLVRMSPVAEIRPVLCVASGTLPTVQARQALPATVSHADAATNAGRSALLVAALTADPSVLLPATQDLLHQQYRAPAMPRTADLVSRLRSAGIPAVVSGAGPSVLAFLTPDSSARLAELGSIVQEMGNGWHVSPLEVDRQGATVQFGHPDAKSGTAPRKAWSGSGPGRIRPGSAAPPEPQDRSSSSAAHEQLSREYRGLSWC